MSYHGGMGASWYEPEYSEVRANLEATNRSIMETEAKTPLARKLKDDWIEWYEDLSYYERNMDWDTWDEARNRRNEFWEANATTPEELEQVQTVIREGMTSEEYAGEARRQRESGRFGDEEPLIPPQYLWIGAGVLVIGAYLHFTLVRPWSKASARLAEKVG